MVDQGNGDELRDSSAMSSDDSSSLILTVADLLPGDILLHQSLDVKKISKRISEATGSPYTHASIYLGCDQIAESVVPKGVQKISLSSQLQNSRCVGVLRTQCVFNEKRVQELHRFVDAVIKNGKIYDFKNVIKFEKESEKYFDNQLEFIQDNYGVIKPNEDFEVANYFCSSFVVACWLAVKIIDGSAQPAYPPKFFSPAGLSRDTTFGWLFGYLLPNDRDIPDGDPLVNNATLWRDHKEIQWW